MLVYQRVPKVIHLQVDLILCFEKGEKTFYHHFTIILPIFTYVYLPTYIYLYLPIFTYIYLYLPIFT